EPVPGIQPGAAGQGGAVAPPLFEQGDFDDILKPLARNRPALPRSAPPVPAEPAPVRSIPLPSSYDVEPLSPNGGSSSRSAPGGLWLSPAQAMLLTAAVVLLLGVAFGMGLLVGWWLR